LAKRKLEQSLWTALHYLPLREDQAQLAHTPSNNSTTFL